MQRWFDVRVMIVDESWLDAVWATSEEEALIVAWWNWECAKDIELV